MRNQVSLLCKKSLEPRPVFVVQLSLRVSTKESDIKSENRWVSCFIISHFGKNSKEAIFRTWRLNFSQNPATIRKNPSLQHNPSDSVIISTHKAQFLIDCKTVCIFAYSSTREQSNKRSGMRLITESCCFVVLFVLRHALPILYWFWEKNRLFCSLAVCFFRYSIGMLPFSLHLSPLWALPLLGSTFSSSIYKHQEFPASGF